MRECIGIWGRLFGHKFVKLEAVAVATIFAVTIALAISLCIIALVVMCLIKLYLVWFT